MEEKMSVNGREYRIRKLLGKGKGGYSYLAEDERGVYVLKQIHHEPCDYYQFGNKIEAEQRDYERLRKIGIKMPKMLDVDVEKERILKEYIEGDTIYDLVLQDKVKAIYLEQMKKMCDLLYPANTNIDYFPTNFVVNNDEIYYIDFECNDYMEEWNFENWGIKYWSKTKEFIGYVNKEIVKKFFKEGYENHNYDKVMSIVADNYIDNSPAGARSNKDAVEILKIIENTFTDLKIDIMDIFEENNMVATRVKYSGIHSGECMKIEATGKAITFEALENFKLQDGKIIESWGYWPDMEIKKKLEE